MKQMKGIVFQELKNIDSMAIIDVPYPTPKPGEAVVKIKAAALNHRDVWITKGLYAGIKVPIILGSDGSGIVAEVADPADNAWLEKPVMINPGLDWGENSRAQQRSFRILGLPDNGTQAEYVTVPVVNLVEKPAYLSFEAAAAVPLGGLTGYRALFTQGGLAAGETVLITGVGGGVASLMMQMAAAVNARVLVTSGDDEKIARAIENGASGGANYRKENWTGKIAELAGKGGIDLIVDSAGGAGFPELTSLVNPGGRITFFGATAGNPPGINLRQIFWKQITIQGTTMGTPRDFEQMVHLFESYSIKPFIDGPYPFTRFREAYQQMIDGQQFGKIVLSGKFE